MTGVVVRAGLIGIVVDLQERIEVDAKGPSKDIVEAIQAIEGIHEVERSYVQDGGFSTYVVRADANFDLRSQMAVAIVNGGWELLRLQSIGMSLEDIFLRLTTTEEVLEV